MRIKLLVIFIFFSGLVNAASDPPSPAPTKSITKPETKANQNNQNTQPSQKVTQKPSTNIGIPEPSNINIKTTNDAQNGNDYSSPEWWMVYFTFALCFITGILAFFTARLWDATKTMVERSEIAAHRQSIEMQESLAIANKSIDLTTKQTELATRQTELLRWQYFTTHRPRLIIRRISLDAGIDDTYIHNVTVPKIQFIVANIGGSRATIIESNATFAIHYETLPAIPPYSLDTNIIKCTTREAGQSDPPEFLYFEDIELRKLMINWNRGTFTKDENSPYYFFGYIQYRDEIGIVRRMTFCRRYSLITKRFTKVDDSEYEYGD